jgi:hypothetical protein
MSSQQEPSIYAKLLDPSRPWLLRYRSFAFPSKPCRATAAEWNSLLARAESDDVDAQCLVAAYFEDGCLTPLGKTLARKSVRKAREWHQRAAALGDPIALVSLANSLTAPGATKQNWQAGIRLYRKAILAGSSTAAENRAVTYRLANEMRRAVLWFRKAQASRDDCATLQLAIHTYWGIGIRANHVEAVRLFRKASKARAISQAEREDALFYLAIAYLEGKGVRQSTPMARKLLERANIDNDNDLARRLLKMLPA